MTATVTSFGDSLGVLFPKSLLKNMHFLEDEDVEVLVRDNSLIITRRENKKRLTTKERIAAFCGKAEDVQLSEIDWGKPQGKEVW